jgi:hypothetical protein
LGASILDDFLAPRPCLREPIGAIYAAAQVLGRAADANLAGDHALARELLCQADDPTVRLWCEPLLGSSKAYPDRDQYVRLRRVLGAPPVLPKPERIPVRMPSAAQKAALIARDGLQCAFCRIPLIRAEVRAALATTYPDVVRWGASFVDCHAAFLCMWLQYDHVLPHSRGGDNSLENVVLTCSACNYGRMSHTLDEVGVIDPRGTGSALTSWDGLERVVR